MSTNLCSKQKCEKYNFYQKFFHFLVVKFSVYLNRHVFLMSYISMKAHVEVLFQTTSAQHIILSRNKKNMQITPSYLELCYPNINPGHAE